MIKSQFIWLICQNGIEHALKAEVQNKYPEFKFSFSRPGFLTYKLPNEVSTPPQLNLIFARVYGIALGKVKLSDALTNLENILKPFFLMSDQIEAIHVFEREKYFIDESPKNFAPLPEMVQLKEKCDTIQLKTEATEKLILDLIHVDGDELWVGLHDHDDRAFTFFSTLPGGQSGLVLPKNAPSRAWLKIEEMILWSKKTPQKGDVAVELGCAPGGALLVLLDRGLTVYGIDSAGLSPEVSSHPNLKHLQESVFQLNKNLLPTKTDWILVDMNTEPTKSLSALARIMDTTGLPKKAALLTFKMSKKNTFDEIPRIIEHLKRQGFKYARAKQLPSHKREIGIFANG